ncbi:MAG TPA: hypothetical protein RMG48_20525 [Myxococcales bacterium LLY-WYZ-16_1]|nr:hypothetical protein [Myxococcales bacterium LLY-WYZ-16_1]
MMMSRSATRRSSLAFDSVAWMRTLSTKAMVRFASPASRCDDVRLNALNALR